MPAKKTLPEVADKLDAISNLWIAYHGCGKFPDDFGREFFHAVGKVLQGHAVGELSLYHIDPSRVVCLVSHNRNGKKRCKIHNSTEEANYDRKKERRKQR